jgi:hypothetical protein
MGWERYISRKYSLLPRYIKIECIDTNYYLRNVIKLSSSSGSIVTSWGSIPIKGRDWVLLSLVSIEHRRSGHEADSHFHLVRTHGAVPLLAIRLHGAVMNLAPSRAYL